MDLEPIRCVLSAPQQLSAIFAEVLLPKRLLMKCNHLICLPFPVDLLKSNGMGHSLNFFTTASKCPTKMLDAIARNELKKLSGNAFFTEARRSKSAYKYMYINMIGHYYGIIGILFSSCMHACMLSKLYTHEPRNNWYL